MARVGEPKSKDDAACRVGEKGAEEEEEGEGTPEGVKVRRISVGFEEDKKIHITQQGPNTKPTGCSKREGGVAGHEERSRVPGGISYRYTYYRAMQVVRLR